MNQARKFNFKTHVEKLNPTSRTDLSNKTLHSMLYWKILFKPFPYKSFGWCNAHSVQADALWGRSFKFQMKNTPQNQYFPANAERMDVHCLESGCIGKYIPLGPRDFPRAWILHPSVVPVWYCTFIAGNFQWQSWPTASCGPLCIENCQLSKMQYQLSLL